MKLEEAINKYFSRDSLVNSICKYQLYYQIGLGKVVLDSIQDLEASYKKLDELNLQIDSQKVFESIHKIVLYLSNNDNFEDKFETHLKMSALAQMLTNFVEADSELIGSEHYADMVYKKIEDDTFFTEKMKEQFDNDFEFILPNWEATITDEIANDIKDVVTEIFNKKG